MGESNSSKADKKPGSWNPDATIAVAIMLGLLAGGDIWVYTAAEISALPQVQVQLVSVKQAG